MVTPKGHLEVSEHRLPSTHAYLSKRITVGVQDSVPSPYLEPYGVGRAQSSSLSNALPQGDKAQLAVANASWPRMGLGRVARGNADLAADQPKIRQASYFDFCDNAIIESSVRLKFSCNFTSGFMLLCCVMQPETVFRSEQESGYDRGVKYP